MSWPSPKPHCRFLAQGGEGPQKRPKPKPISTAPPKCNYRGLLATFIRSQLWPFIPFAPGFNSVLDLCRQTHRRCPIVLVRPLILAINAPGARRTAPSTNDWSPEWGIRLLEGPVEKKKLPGKRPPELPIPRAFDFGMTKERGTGTVKEWFGRRKFRAFLSSHGRLRTRVIRKNENNGFGTTSSLFRESPKPFHLVHPERSRGICSPRDLSWKCFFCHHGVGLREAQSRDKFFQPGE